MEDKIEEAAKDEDTSRDEKRIGYMFYTYVSLILIFLSIFSPWFEYRTEDVDPFAFGHEGQQIVNIVYFLHGQNIDFESGTLEGMESFENWEEKGSDSLKALFYSIAILITISILSILLALIRVRDNKESIESKYVTSLLLLGSICIILIPILFTIAAPGVMEEDVNKLESTGDSIKLNGLFGTNVYNDGDYILTWGPSFGWFFTLFAAFSQVMILFNLWKDGRLKFKIGPHHE